MSDELARGPRPAETEPLNPVALEQAIRDIVNEIARGVKIVSARQAEMKQAARVLDLAFAHAYMRHAGPAHEKKYAAEVATQKQRHDAEVAELAFKHTERAMDQLERELSAYQSLLKSVTQAYGAAGTGFGS